MRAITVLLVSLGLLSGCSGSGDSTTSDPTTGSVSASTPTSETTESVDDTTEGTGSLASFDPFDAEWVIQQDAVVVVIGADGQGAFSPTVDVSGFDENNPDWSSDGARLAFTVADGRDDLWVVGVDGVGARKLYACESPCDYVDDPAWSPDGKSIAICKMTESGADHLGTLIGLDVDTGAETTLATFTPEDFCAGPRWSPDGSEISFELVHRAGTAVSDEVIGVTLSVADLSSDPAAIRPLTDPALFASWGDWNPAGDLLVYSALSTPDARAPDLFTVRPDGSDRRQLTNLAAIDGSATQPTFDLDGASVVFVDEIAGSLLRVDLATGAVTNAFATDTFGDHPRPRPLR